MVLGDLFEQAVTIEKTVWQKRGDKIVRKNVSRLLAKVVETRLNPLKGKVDGE